jgi:hypothetical protein
LVCDFATPSLLDHEEALAVLESTKGTVDKIARHEPADHVRESLKEILNSVEKASEAVMRWKRSSAVPTRRTYPLMPQVATIQGPVGHLGRESGEPWKLAITDHRWTEVVDRINRSIALGHALISPDGIAIQIDNSADDLSEECLSTLGTTIEDMTEGDLSLVPHFTSMP